MAYPKINRGERALLAGRTGSGKSVLACWLLNRSAGSWVILNPKNTQAYYGLNDSVVIEGIDYKKIEDAFTARRNRPRFIIVNPISRNADADTLDDFILWLHESWQGVGLCCDELYTLHKGAVAGKGLLGWLTRGRELKQSFLGLTQRPAWLSQFLFSESDYIGTMALQLKADKKRFVQMTDNPIFDIELDDHHWLWYDTRQRNTRLLGAVPMY